MTATIVTPEMVRVVFLRRRNRSCCFSCGFMAAIMSAFDGVRGSVCLAAAWFFARFKSVWVGDCKTISASMISLAALSTFNFGVPC